MALPFVSPPSRSPLYWINLVADAVVSLTNKLVTASGLAAWVAARCTATTAPTTADGGRLVREADCTTAASAANPVLSVGGLTARSVSAPGVAVGTRLLTEAQSPVTSGMSVDGDPCLNVIAGVPTVDYLRVSDGATTRSCYHILGNGVDDHIVLQFEVTNRQPLTAWLATFLTLDHFCDDLVNVQIVVRIYDTGGTLRYTGAVAESLTWAAHAVAAVDGTIPAGTWGLARFLVEIDVTLDAADNCYIATPRV